MGYVAAVSENELDSDDPLVELPDFRIGKSGVEKSYDLELRGTAGTSQVEVNAFGRVVRELAHEDGMSGQEIVLTIDMALQDLAARRCAAEGSGRRRDARRLDRRGAGDGFVAGVTTPAPSPPG